MALEAIALGLHREDLSINFSEASWDADSKTNANSIPFLDHIITELDSQFSALAQTAFRLLGLVPSVLCSRKDLGLRYI